MYSNMHVHNLGNLQHTFISFHDLCFVLFFLTDLYILSAIENKYLNISERGHQFIPLERSATYNKQTQNASPMTRRFLKGINQQLNTFCYFWFGLLLFLVILKKCFSELRERP